LQWGAVHALADAAEFVSSHVVHCRSLSFRVSLPRHRRRRPARAGASAGHRGGGAPRPIDEWERDGRLTQLRARPPRRAGRCLSWGVPSGQAASTSSSARCSSRVPAKLRCTCLLRLGLAAAEIGALGDRPRSHSRSGEVPRLQAPCRPSLRVGSGPSPFVTNVTQCPVARWERRTVDDSPNQERSGAERGLLIRWLRSVTRTSAPSTGRPKGEPCSIDRRALGRSPGGLRAEPSPARPLPCLADRSHGECPRLALALVLALTPVEAAGAASTHFPRGLAERCCGTQVVVDCRPVGIPEEE
jgi:hypothetical protein